MKWINVYVESAMYEVNQIQINALLKEENIPLNVEYVTHWIEFPLPTLKYTVDSEPIIAYKNGIKLMQL